MANCEKCYYRIQLMEFYDHGVCPNSSLSFISQTHIQSVVVPSQEVVAYRQSLI